MFPKLRFKEFDGDWTLTTLNQLSTKIGDGIHATPKYDESGTIPFINGNNLVNGRVIINENTKRISNEEFQKYNQVLSDRTLFLSINGTIGNLAFYKNEKVLLGKSVCFINLKNDLDKKFIYLLLQSPQLTKTLNSELTGTTIKNLSLATVRNSEFYCPIEAEQTKIASFLSAVDEKISQLTQKHALLSQYKQGMMQKLFSQQIRFKADDGSEFGEWETTTLGQTGKFIGGGTPSKENSEFWEGSIPWISSSDLTEESIFKINITRFISQNALNQSATKLVPANSILIVSRVGVGKVAITPNEICTSQDFTSLTLHKGSSIFFAYLIKSLTPYLLEMNQGTSIKGFIKDDLANLELKIPCIEEQTKIANFLSAIDQKIEVVAQQIEQAKTWKKGLLQQMFI